MHGSRRTLGALAMAATIALAGAALGLGSGFDRSAAAQGGEVNVYSSRHYDTDDALYGQFTAETGIKVNVIEGGEDQLIERMKAEGANSPADVLLTVDAGRLWRAQEAGLLQPIRSEVLEQRVPLSYRDPEGHWFGFARRVRVIAYARDRVDPADLSTYEGLADPRWRGKVLVRSSSHVYNQSLVGSMIEAIGPEATEAWARGLVANFARPPQGGDTDQLLALAAGEGDVAIVNHYYYARLASSDKPEDQQVASKIGIFFPNQAPGDRGVHTNISGGGVAAAAPNRDNAVAFLEFLTAPAAQELFARGSMEFPVVDGVPLHPVLESLGSFRSDALNARVFGANNQTALLLMNRAGWR